MGQLSSSLIPYQSQILAIYSLKKTHTISSSFLYLCIGYTNNKPQYKNYLFNEPQRKIQTNQWCSLISHASPVSSCLLGKAIITYLIFYLAFSLWLFLLSNLMFILLPYPGMSKTAGFYSLHKANVIV